ncbi:MAG TPA: hypothetical protein VHG28_07285, partial [Longimicrobiaceae bacterium]|nr:hypothetical protein [Longimicrobiaceae bacterium]
MYRIALVNLPMADLHMPSLALTQLQAVVRRELGDLATVEIHYLNHDFAHYLGVPAYLELSSFEHHPTGLGEWLFRPVAFPDEPDNTVEYLGRYYPRQTPRDRRVRERVEAARPGLAEHFDTLIDRYGLDRADLVGFTSMFSQNLASLGMARRPKARNPDVTVVLGGA